MFTKVVALFALVAAAQAGVAYVDQHVGAQSEQTIRGLGYGGFGTVSHQTKAVDSAFSSVRKHDTRVINPAVAAVAAPVAYAPAAYAAPAYAQAAYAAPAYAQAAYAAPAYAPAAYAAPAYAGVAKVAAPVAYAAPVAKAVAAPASLLGVAYSAVPQVAHLNFDGFGVHYGY